MSLRDLITACRALTLGCVALAMALMLDHLRELRMTAPCRSAWRALLRSAFLAGTTALSLGLGLGLANANELQAIDDDQRLFQLVPADAALIVQIPDLRTHANSFWNSPWVQRVRRLPATRGWLESPAFQQFEQARTEIEAALGSPLTRVRDELLGDDLVLSLHQPRDEPQNAARGLFLTRFRDRALLDRVMETINTLARANGLVEVRERTIEIDGREHTYSLRIHQPAEKPAEAYTILDGNILAWSNSESLLKEVLNRHVASIGNRDHGGETVRSPALAGAHWRAIRSALPRSSLIRAYLDVPALLKTTSLPKPGSNDWVGRILADYLGAVRGVGVAVQWQGGLVAHWVEALEPGRLDPSLARWLRRPGRIEPLLRRVPPNALAVATGHVDLSAVLELVERTKAVGSGGLIEQFELMARGVLLDLPPRELASQVGPNVLASLSLGRTQDTSNEQQGAGDLRATVLMATTLPNREAAAALFNAARTVFATVAFDHLSSGKDRSAKAVARNVDGAPIVELVRAGTPPLAAATSPTLFVLGTNAATVAGFLAEPTGPGPLQDSPIHLARKEHFLTAQTFLAIDLAATRAAAEGHEDEVLAWIRQRANDANAPSRADLDQVLELLHCFRVAFFATTVDPESWIVHRTLGLLAEQP